MSAVFLVTGGSATAVGRSLASRFVESVHVDGETIDGMLVRGSPNVMLRHRVGALVADSYAVAGFTTVHTEAMAASEVANYPDRITMRPLYVVCIDQVEPLPRVGLWLDASAQTVEATVDEILDRLDEALISD